MDTPIMNFYSFQSAEYAVAKDKWQDVDINVFHHQAHAYNVQRMIEAVKDSLTYYSEAFSPYQYKQVKILEFPDYRTIAQAFPATIPFSEGIGFIADMRDPNTIDLPYYVTAHEMAHQWWGYQVMAADVQGGSMLIETLSQYSAMLVMEKKYGSHQARKFLKIELERYLEDRGNESEGELPLYKVEGQSYLHYRKGSLVMYALKDYLGEEVINSAIRKLIQHHAYQSSPYAVSSDLIRYLKEETPVEQHNLLDDFLKKITMFDLKLIESNVTTMTDGRFKVSLKVEATKFYEDEIGQQEEALFDIPVDIGLFIKNPDDSDFKESDIIKLGKQQVNGGLSTIEFIVEQEPKFAGIDPYHKLIDREPDDNIGEVAVDSIKGM